MWLMIGGICKIHINIKNQVQNHSEELIQPEKTETKNILIEGENFVIYFTRYVNCKLMKMLSQQYL